MSLFKHSDSSNIARKSNQDFAVYSLFTWTPNQDPMLNNLIMSLKGGKLPVAFKRLAMEFWIRRRFVPMSQPPIFFIPAPGQSEKSFDHASAWAAALAEIFNGQVVSCLKRNTISSQKSLSLQERKEAKLVYDGLPLVSGRYVFVDDVITSGSTANAAFMALQKPKNYEVWTICHRTRLAPS